MKIALPAIILVALSHSLMSQTSAPENISPFSIGKRVEIFSESLQENRFLNIYLPHAYSPDSTIAYQVIYLLDGSADEDFIHVAGLIQFCSYPWIAHLPPSIVVGIENVDRQRDFTYPTDREDYLEQVPTLGGSAAFISFLQEEVKPYIESNYAVEGKGMIIGQSLGGLLASEILVRQPDLFDTYMIVSPSLWWDEQSLFEETPAPITSEIEVYIAVGEEGRVMKSVAKKLYKSSKNRNNIDALHFEFVKHHDHADILHEALYRMFRQRGKSQPQP